MAASKKSQYLARKAELELERASWLDLWRELNDHFCPRLARFLAGDQNKGTKLNDKIINSTPLIAVRVNSSGMMAGCSSPSRTWFRVTTPDPTLAEQDAAKVWLAWVEERMRKAMAASDLYLALARGYEEECVFGTDVLWIEPGEKDRLFHAETIPIGQYCLACGADGQVDTLYRSFRMTVSQLVEKFGLEACSASVKREWDEKHFDAWHDVCHVVEPRLLRDEQSPLALDMPWASTWFEVASDDDQLLLESGYEEKPFAAARWYLTAGDVYGRSPAMDCLGDAKALQKLESRKLAALEKHINPPMVAPSSMREERASLLPGDVTYVDTVTGGQTFQPAIRVDPNAIAEIGREILRHEQRINDAMLVSIFMMLSQSDRRQITATEVEERKEEKALQIGPALERLHYELFAPIIARTFGIMARANLIPPPPPELEGVELKIEFVSVLAAAQKLTGVVAIERFASFMGNVSAALPEVIDVLEPDKAAREYASAVGLDPELLRPEDAVKALREQRAQAAQQAQAAQTAQTAQTVAQGAQTLAQTDVRGDSALSRLLSASGAGLAPGIGQT